MSQQRIDHLIDGKRVVSGRYFETIDPSTQAVLAEVASGGEAEVDQAVRLLGHAERFGNRAGAVPVAKRDVGQKRGPREVAVRRIARKRLRQVVGGRLVVRRDHRIAPGKVGARRDRGRVGPLGRPGGQDERQDER